MQEEVNVIEAKEKNECFSKESEAIGAAIEKWQLGKPCSKPCLNSTNLHKFWCQPMESYS